MIDAKHYNFAFLDEGSKREIRRSILKAVAIPGYQVPFGSRELPIGRGWGTGGIQITLSIIGREDVLKVIDQGNDEGAKVYLERQQENKDKMEVLKNSLKEIKENSVLQKETVDKLYDDLKALKAEKDKAVFTLETVEATKALKPDTGVGSNEQEKMLQKVREGVQKAKEESDGNRIAYENSAEVQKKRLDKQMKDNAIDQKLAELKAKKGKK